MSLPRQHRRWLSIGLLITLLFTQWVTSVHACPALATPAAPAAQALPCDDHAPQSAEPLQLCKAHCEQGRQAVHTAQAGDIDAPPVLLAVVDWAAAVFAVPQAAVPRDPALRPGTAPPGSPPLYLTLHVLRN